MKYIYKIKKLDLAPLDKIRDLLHQNLPIGMPSPVRSIITYLDGIQCYGSLDRDYNNYMMSLGAGGYVRLYRRKSDYYIELEMGNNFLLDQIKVYGDDKGSIRLATLYNASSRNEVLTTIYQALAGHCSFVSVIRMTDAGAAIDHLVELKSLPREAELLMEYK